MNNSEAELGERSNELRVEIISPIGYLFNGLCFMAVVPSVNGEIGFMINHESVLSSLRAGKITIYDDNKMIIKELEVSSGFAEMIKDKLLILVD